VYCQEGGGDSLKRQGGGRSQGGNHAGTGSVCVGYLRAGKVGEKRGDGGGTRGATGKRVGLGRNTRKKLQFVWMGGLFHRFSYSNGQCKRDGGRNC